MESTRTGYNAEFAKSKEKGSHETTYQGIKAKSGDFKEDVATAPLPASVEGMEKPSFRDMLAKNLPPQQEAPPALDLAPQPPFDKENFPPLSAAEQARVKEESWPDLPTETRVPTSQEEKRTFVEKSKVALGDVASSVKEKAHNLGDATKEFGSSVKETMAMRTHDAVEYLKGETTEVAPNTIDKGMLSEIKGIISHSVESIKEKVAEVKHPQNDSEVPSKDAPDEVEKDMLSEIKGFIAHTVESIKEHVGPIVPDMPQADSTTSIPQYQPTVVDAAHREVKEDNMVSLDAVKHAFSEVGTSIKDTVEKSKDIIVEKAKGAIETVTSLTDPDTMLGRPLDAPPSPTKDVPFVSNEAEPHVDGGFLESVKEAFHHTVETMKEKASHFTTEVGADDSVDDIQIARGEDTSSSIRQSAPAGWSVEGAFKGIESGFKDPKHQPGCPTFAPSMLARDRYY